MKKFDVNDIVGKRFGKLVVLAFDHKKPHKNSTGFTYYYLCKCDCGNTKIIDRSSLRRTNGTQSCGCISLGENIIGKKFGRLTVLKIDHLKPRFYPNGAIRGHRTFYLCECECGNKKVVNRDYLIQAREPSCGCVGKDNQRIARTTHNLASHRLYNIYHKIISRCYKPQNKAYKDYGARGITMDDKWKRDFVTFYNWAINNGYSEEYSLDRINVNGNYEPSNCRWVTSKIQNNNKRSNFLVTIYNRTQTLAEWCEEKNINYSTVQTRLSKGWSLEKAMTAPTFQYKQELR